MLKKVSLILVFVVSINGLLACDICGCSSGNFFLGPTPKFSSYFAGVRYSQRSYKTVLSSDDTQFSRDFYQTVEFWGGIKIRKKFQLLAFMPYNINRSVTDDGNKLGRGFGDLTVVGNYPILDRMSMTKDTESVSQQWWIGVGVKLPTGKFSVDANEVVSSANSQAGTGSLDFIITSTYTLVIDDYGLTGNMNYKVNQAASGFQFGNRFSATGFGFRSYSSGNKNISPNVGLMYEELNPNKLDGEVVASTGGSALLGVAGVEVQLDKINVGMNIQLPVWQHLSDGQTTINWRGMAHVTYSF